MKNLKSYIQEAFKLGDDNFKSRNDRYKYHPENRNELKEILSERLKEDPDADLNDIDVSNVTDMSKLFIFLDPQEINISDWDVSNVEDMSFMFYECTNFNCDLSNWDVSNVEDMRSMFDSCNNFKGEGLENWNINNNANMKYMFEYCKSLKNKPSWYKEN